MHSTGTRLARLTAVTLSPAETQAPARVDPNPVQYRASDFALLSPSVLAFYDHVEIEKLRSRTMIWPTPVSVTKVTPSAPIHDCCPLDRPVLEYTL